MRCNRGNHPLQIPCQSGGLLLAAAKKLIDKYKAHDLHFPAPVESVPHKQSIEDMIGDGFLAEAIRNEIYEIRSTFGEKYDGAIGEYLDAMCRYIRENSAPSLKEP